MSLHTLANHLQSAGRGEDKVLVHMTPGEVNGLQSLAMAHGGSLTINPETGLPEAGFLSSLLPMVAGFALGPAGLGLTAMQAGLASAAIGTVATGSLQKGIMAGLGAYGGAGLGAGLSSLGAPAVAPAQAGLSPAVAANTSTAAGNNLFAKVGAEPFTLADDAFLGAAKTPVTGPGQAMAFDPTYMSKTGGTSQALGQALSSAAAPPPPVISTTAVPDPAAPTTTAPVADARVVPKRVMDIDGLDVYERRRGDVGEIPSGRAGATFTAKRPFAGGMYGQYTGPSNAVDLSSQAGVSPVARSGITRTELYPGQADPSIPVRTYTGPVRESMAQLGRGAKTALSGTDGLKALYAAQEAAAPYSSIAGLGATAYGYMDEKRKEAAEEMRRRAAQPTGMIRPYEFDYGATGVASQPYSGSAERTYFNPIFTAQTPYAAPGPEYAAAGGLMGLAAGGPVEQMADMNSIGANTGYPMANISTSSYSNPMIQRPEAMNVIAPSADAGVGAYTGEARFAKGGGTAEPKSGGYSYDYNPQTMQFTQTVNPASSRGPGLFNNLLPETFSLARRQRDAAATNKQPTTTGGVAAPIVQPAAPAQSFIPNIDVPAYQTPEQQLGLGNFYDYMNRQMGAYGGYAAGGNVGGISHLGDYSDGGRLLKGPGDGVSDSIPASIGGRQPARLADGEFVVPARIVSEIGNGSTEAGARKLYAMMDRVQKARRKTVGKGQVARNTKAEKLLPA